MGLFNKKELEEIARLKKEIERLSIENKELNTELIHSKKTINEMEKGVHEETNNKIKENEKTLSQLHNIINEKIEKSKKEKASLEEIKEQIEKKKIELNNMNDDIKKKQNAFKSVETRMNNQKEKLIKEKEDLKNEIKNLNNIKESVEDVIETGVIDSGYHYEDSNYYELKLKDIKEKQKEAVKNAYLDCNNVIKDEVHWKDVGWLPSENIDNKAMGFFKAWRIEGSYQKGKIFMKNIAKLALRAFNNECDNIIINVKYSTIENSTVKIKKSYEDINKMIECHECYITEYYLNLKIKELQNKILYVTSKQLEKEEQQRIKEQMKEEERVRKELEAEEKKVEKEEQHFMNELNKLQKRMAKENEENQAKLLKQIEELQAKLSEVSETKADLMNRKMNNKAGYVYIISNKGSLGENVYKIGTTRRLDPQVRVDELSNASVPFKYDVHAMIFTDDAFELENNLHKIFDDKRVNKVNKHKEFFNVTIDEIEKAVKENFNETVEFNKTILNEEYLLSISLEK